MTLRNLNDHFPLRILWRPSQLQLHPIGHFFFYVPQVRTHKMPNLFSNPPCYNDCWPLPFSTAVWAPGQAFVPFPRISFLTVNATELPGSIAVLQILMPFLDTKGPVKPAPEKKLLLHVPQTTYLRYSSACSFTRPGGTIRAISSKFDIKITLIQHSRRYGSCDSSDGERPID